MFIKREEQGLRMGLQTRRSFTFLLSTLLLLLLAMADSARTSKSLDSSSSSPSSPAVHIVYTEKPQEEEPEAFHLRTLTTVLGSEDAAREALVYSYKTAASGFSARLTADQVSQISKQPGVLQVVPSRTLQLHSGPGRLH